MRYRYTINKARNFRVSSPDFPSLVGVGTTENSAFSAFLTIAFDRLRYCLKNNLSVPDEPRRPNPMEKSFGLPFNMILKLRLHNIRLSKSVSKAELARFLSLTHDDVPEDSWNVDKLRTISTQKIPKFKKVQRLFSIDHESTIREIEHAYRVLGYTIDVIPIERKS